MTRQLVDYSVRLPEIGAILLQSFTKAKDTHLFKCSVCQHEWETTPRAIIQSSIKHNTNSCPECSYTRRYKEQQEKNKASLPTFIEVVSDWNGTRNFQGSAEATKVTFRNTICEHEFTTYPNYVLRGKTHCTVCGEYERIEELKKRNKDRRTDQNYDAWLEYKNRVGYLTRKNYHAHEQQLNPNGHPIGLCGIEGGHQIDHILPKSVAYKIGIPEELISHVDNIQVLPWEENRQKSAKLLEIPAIFEEYRQAILDFYKDA